MSAGRPTPRELWAILTVGERLALTAFILAAAVQAVAVLHGVLLAAMVCGGINGYLAVRIARSLGSRKGTDL